MSAIAILRDMDNYQIDHLARPIPELLAEYNDRRPKKKGVILKFDGVEGKDVYNITSPFKEDGIEYLVGRVEKRSSKWLEDDYDVAIRIFKKDEEDGWAIHQESPAFKLHEDPDITPIGDNIVLSGVLIYDDSESFWGKNYRTVFYGGSIKEGWEKIAEGPIGMKDIRLVEMLDGRIGVFTRPQGDRNKRGRIGFRILSTLDELGSVDLTDSQMIPELFANEEWGGVNQAITLPDGRLGCIGHIANNDRYERKFSYYAVAFELDPKIFKTTQVRIIATRDDFLESDSKSPRIVNCLFPGGIVRKEGGKADLYTGISDCVSGRIEIDDPFESSCPL